MIKARDTRAREAFVDVADVQVGSRVLDLGWEGDCLECLRETGTRVTFVGEDIRAVQKAEALRINGVLSAMPARVVSDAHVVFYKPAQRSAKGQVFEWIDQGFQALEIGGTLYLAGQRNRGVRSYVKYLHAVFGNSRRAGRVDRVEIYSANKEQDEPCQAPIDNRMTFELRDLPGSPYSFETVRACFRGMDSITDEIADRLHGSSSCRPCAGLGMWLGRTRYGCCASICKG